MEPKNCWEFWDCPEEVKEKCPAFTTNSGKECFNLAKDFCPKIKHGEFEHCWECTWYKKIKPPDPYAEKNRRSKS